VKFSTTEIRVRIREGDMQACASVTVDGKSAGLFQGSADEVWASLEDLAGGMRAASAWLRAAETARGLIERNGAGDAGKDAVA
jgi:hypothetical protein